MKIDVLNKSGKAVEKLDLDDSVFGVEPNTELLTQYLRVFRANARQGTSAVKTRDQVSGGGRKPWRQKGTGRARHGSIRSPIWVGGGVSHGPRPKSWNLSFPKKMKRAAMVSALSVKKAKDAIKVLDELKMKQPKTKELFDLLKSLKIGGRVLVITPSKDDVVLKSARNIQKVKVVSGETLSAYDLLRAHNVLFLKDAVVSVQEKYKNETK